MDKDTFLKYLPLACVIIAIILQFNLFVTPEKLEIKHREILSDIANQYTTKDQTGELKTQVLEMSKKIDRMYDIITSRA